MRLALFGATGKSGVLTTKKTLSVGHHITAYARNPSKLQMQHPNLTVVQGELTNAAKISQAVQGQNAVLSLLGPTGKDSGDELTQGIRSMIAAMQEHGVRRIVATSTPSVVDPADRRSLSFSLAIGAIKLFQRNAYDNLIRSAEALRSSDLAWTLVRLPMLTDKETAPPPAAGLLAHRESSCFLFPAMSWPTF